MTVQIWVDADSCPTLVRNHIINYSKKLSLPVFFVANKQIPAESDDFTMIICPEEKDSADNYIFEHVQANDLVITRDIVFADRDFDLQLAEMGLGGSKKSNYGPKQFSKFANCFDRIIHKLIIDSQY